MDESHEESGGKRVSTEFGRITLADFLARWNAPEAVRFRYEPIRLAGLLILVTGLGLWGYYLYSVFWGVGLTLGLGLFGIVLLLATGYVALRLLSWRLFVLRSGVAMTPDVLVWRTGPACYLAPWRLIEPEGLGLETLAFAEGSGYDRFVTIRVGDAAEPIFLVRLYTKLADYEVFLGELLERIPKEKWEKVRAQDRKQSKSGSDKRSKMGKKKRGA